MDRRTLNIGLVASIALPFLPASARALDLGAALAPRVLGDPDAPVTMIEYSSKTCPHCASFHVNTLPDLKERFIETGQVKLEYRDFPLDRFALQASAMARAVPQERFFGLVDLLFKQQSKWARGTPQEVTENLLQIGRFAGLKREEALEAMSSQALADGILEIRLEGQRQYEVGSTPTFIIDGTKVTGARDISEFAEVIEDKLG